VTRSSLLAPVQHSGNSRNRHCLFGKFHPWEGGREALGYEAVARRLLHSRIGVRDAATNQGYTGDGDEENGCILQSMPCAEDATTQVRRDCYGPGTRLLRRHHQASRASMQDYKMLPLATEGFVDGRRSRQHCQKMLTRFHSSNVSQILASICHSGVSRLSILVLAVRYDGFIISAQATTTMAHRLVGSTRSTFLVA